MACLQINIEGLGTFRGCKSFTAKVSTPHKGKVESHVGEFAGDDIGSEHHYDEMGRAVKPPARRR